MNLQPNDCVYMFFGNIDPKLQIMYRDTGRLPKRFSRKKRQKLLKVLRGNWYMVRAVNEISRIISEEIIGVTSRSLFDSVRVKL